MNFIQKKINDIEKNEKYVEKSSPWSTHSKISSYLRKLPSHTRILDIGCATGILGKLCSDNRFIFKGIEENAEWANDAKPYYEEIFPGRIENASDEFLKNYDVIILADVIEHLPNCEEIVLRIVNLQKVGCLFIISVPNIANLWVRLNLLFGKFDYMERGILDKTHVRFFTYKSLINFLLKSGLKASNKDYTPIPLELVNTFFTDNSLGKFIYRIFNLITGLFPKLLGYQFIVIANKTSP
jgi:2-polyprenyl-3-methyl-5-hydroxy-6-metoxy-1,4-benzoquinol methylase